MYGTVPVRYRTDISKNLLFVVRTVDLLLRAKVVLVLLPVGYGTSTYRYHLITFTTDRR